MSEHCLGEGMTEFAAVPGIQSSFISPSLPTGQKPSRSCCVANRVTSVVLVFHIIGTHGTVAVMTAFKITPDTGNGSPLTIMFAQPCD